MQVAVEIGYAARVAPLDAAVGLRWITVPAVRLAETVWATVRPFAVVQGPVLRGTAHVGGRMVQPGSQSYVWCCQTVGGVMHLPLPHCGRKRPATGAPSLVNTTGRALHARYLHLNTRPARRVGLVNTAGSQSAHRYHPGDVTEATPQHRNTPRTTRSS